MTANTASGIDAARSAPPIATAGVLCRGIHVDLAWPEEHEFDVLTAMRNRPGVRNRFLDPRPLDVIANRTWLRSGMRRPFEGLLSIRRRDGAFLLGMIGWSNLDRSERSVELGRLVVDAHAARLHPELRATGYPGVAVDAGHALRDFMFEQAGMDLVRTVYLADNAPAKRINDIGRSRVVAVRPVQRPDGTTVDVIQLEISRSEWQSTSSVRGR